MPATRTRTYSKRILERAGEPVLDVPDLAVLSYRSPALLLADFEQVWGIKPRSAVLPVISADGVNFENPVGLPISRVCRKEGGNPAKVDFASSVSDFASLGCDVYLSLNPSVSFVSANPLFLVDSVADTAHQTCIAKDGMREILSEVLAEGVMLAHKSMDSTEPRTSCRLRGVVFNLVNVWPMSATAGRIELTCFCETCKAIIEKIMRNDYDPPDLLDHFRDFPSPANLLLSDSGTGISFVESLSSTSGPGAIVGLAKMKGFDEVWKGKDDSVLQRSARYLMSYLRARHQLTVEAIQNIFAAAKEILAEENVPRTPDELQSILLLEGDPYDWSSGLFLDLLDASAAPGGHPACDELWMDPTSGAPAVRNLTTRTYMWRRSRYLIDSLFDSIASISSDTIRTITAWGRYEMDDVQRMLDARKRTTLGARMEGLPALQGLRPEEANRIGFVGAGLSDAVLEPLIKDVPVVLGRFDLPHP